MWRLLDLGAVDGYTMTNLYEAIGLAVSNGDSPNTVILNHPESPFVNIGYHQLMDKEINVEEARKRGYSLVRRTIGGGAILDGPWEQDYFVVVRRSDPSCPTTIPEFYSRFLKPPLYALRQLGLEPSIRQPNDILVGGRKISGNGAITIDGVNVLAGDILLEAPAALMSEIIKVPSEKFRDKLAKSMSEWITSLSSLLGEVKRGDVKRLIVDGFINELGLELEPRLLTEAEKSKLDELVSERMTEKWVFSKDNDILMKVGGDRLGTKVRGGVNVTESVYKAGKMIRVVLVSEEGCIRDLSLSGDFFTIPYTGALEQLEKTLVGSRLEREPLTARVKEGFSTAGLTVMGASINDFVEAILRAAPETE
jgi:lipoate-protein ligase A